MEYNCTLLKSGLACCLYCSKTSRKTVPLMYLLIKVFLWCLFAKFSVRFMEKVIKFCPGDIARRKVHFFSQKCGAAAADPSQFNSGPD